MHWYAEQQGIPPEEITVLDPFAGSGTTVLVAERMGMPAYGIEAHPVLLRIAQTKLLWDTEPEKFRDFSGKILRCVKNENSEMKEYPREIHTLYTKDILSRLNALRCAWEKLDDETPESHLAWLAITEILHYASSKRRDSPETPLHDKTGTLQKNPRDLFLAQVNRMLEDMTVFQGTAKKTGKIFLGDSRFDTQISDNTISLVITAPPFLNNFDYASASLRESGFWGIHDNEGNLQEKLRKDLVRTFTRRVSSETEEKERYLETLKNTPISGEIKKIAELLEEKRKSSSDKKYYHVMMPAYFSDLFCVWKNLRRMCKEDCTIAFVISDSAHHGVHIPTEEWMGKLAMASGFKEYHFVKTRTQNTQWIPEKEKDPVPLREGILWVR
ncbi:MAG: DNA methyltransferase [Methanoregula sp.]